MDNQEMRELKERLGIINFKSIHILKIIILNCNRTINN